VAGATYEVTRRSNGQSETIIAAPAAATFTDNVPADSAFLYRVRSISSAGTSTFTAYDLATTFLLNPDPFVIGQRIFATDMTRLRGAMDAVRDLAAIPAFSFGDAPIAQSITLVKSDHVADLRTALLEAFDALGFVPPSFTNPATAGAPIRAIDLHELIDAVK